MSSSDRCNSCWPSGVTISARWLLWAVCCWSSMECFTTFARSRFFSSLGLLFELALALVGLRQLVVVALLGLLPALRLAQDVLQTTRCLA